MLRWILRFVVRTYQAALSPFVPSSCRYFPSCSAYMIGCIDKYGPARGLWMGCKRILRCHPLFSGGYDPVP